MKCSNMKDDKDDESQWGQIYPKNLKFKIINALFEIAEKNPHK